MSVLHIKNNDLEQIKNSDKPALLDFYADWCGPCRMLSPVIEAIADERDDILIAKINVDENAELAGEYGVVSIPTLIVIKNGEIVNRAMGARPKSQVLALLD